jgi:isopenicillin-N N-acyltransferase like protein
MTATAAQSKTFPFVDVHGGPRQRGRQHGEACRDQIRVYADTLLRVLSGEAQLRSLSPGPQLTHEDLYARALTFLPAFEAFAPHLVEEIRGIAEGADVPFAAALLVNVRAEVAGVTSLTTATTAPASAASSPAGAPGASTPTAPGAASLTEGCTSFAIGRSATTDGTMFLGQNQDQDPAMEALGVVLRVRPDDGPPMLMATFGGLVGYPGLNAYGVAHFQNALSNGVWKHALPHYPMKRVLLEQRDLDGCLRTIARARLASCGNYVLGDRTGRVLDVETTPDGYATVEPQHGFVTHGNHFRSERYASEDTLVASLPDSPLRGARIQSTFDSARGHLTLDAIKAALRDHEGSPTAICRHDAANAASPMKTIASLIAEPDKGLLHVSRGNPCENDYTTYSVE